MKIVVTGSLGHIGKPLTEKLLQKGHKVSVISSRMDRQKEIVALGAEPAVGTMEDAGFLTRRFKGADIVYVMEALGQGAFFDPDTDIRAKIQAIGRSYKTAILESGVKQVIHLSSIGAHTDQGNGILAFHFDAENILRELPDDVSIKFMRPVGFYNNMFGFIPTIRSRDSIVQNYGGDVKEPWVSTFDIAAVIAEEMEEPFEGRKVRYLASDEVSPNEVAKVLGKAIGKPNLKWLVIPDEEILDRMIASGMNPQTAKGFMEMNAARRAGALYEDYNRNKPALGKVKITDFAKEFAAVYRQNE